MAKRRKGSKHWSRGKRYSAKQKEEILLDAEETTVLKAAEKHGCVAWSIYYWRNQAHQERRRKERAEGENDGKSSVEERSTPSVASSEELSQEQKDRHELILATWRQQPGLGPSQIRNQIKRKGYKASVSTVRRIMEEHGYVQPKKRDPKKHTGRYEAVRPFQLYHLDFYHFHVHRQRQCLLLMLDDFSRFIPGWVLLKSEHAAGVIESFEASVARYGKPEAVMTDRGSAFHSWKGLSRFEALLEEYEVDHYLAMEAAVNGKVEALNASFEKELVRQVEFADLADATRRIADWVRIYNYQRTHQGLGGLLVPADRFHGCSEETLLRIEQGEGAFLPDLLSPDGRGLELFKVVSFGGQPSVYLMGRKLL